MTLTDDEAIDALSTAVQHVLYDRLLGFGNLENTSEALAEAVCDKLDEIYGPLEAIKNCATVELDPNDPTRINVTLTIPRPITFVADFKFEVKP